MKRTDSLQLVFLLLLPILIFFPLFQTTYFYTDEIVQLWLYKKGTDFNMFIPQGRFLNNWLFRSLYSRIDTIEQLKYLRIFALAGWMVSVPVWFSIFKRICKDEGLPGSLAFFATLYLITSLPVGISIQWAACMELFIANTCGLLSGFLVYRYGRKGWLPAIVLGVIALLFYQNGFGCYLLPLFLLLIARQKVDRRMLAPLLVYLAIYLIYYILIKVMMSQVYHINTTERAAFLNDPEDKFLYVFRKILPGAFHFSLVVLETNVIGRIIFGVLTVLGLWSNYRYFVRHRNGGGVVWRDFLFYVVLLFGGYILIYLPSMIIREDFASNRTLLGVDMAVFLWVALTLMRTIQQDRFRSVVIEGLSVVLVIAAIYNFRSIFLKPAQHEYTVLKTYFDKSYDSSRIQSVDYVRTKEDEVRKNFKVQTSWDEYGLSSSYFAWVPDAVTRQLIFEKTGNREAAGKIPVKVWKTQEDWKESGPQPSPEKLIVNVPELLLQ
ncbi:MAG: hypothetical protein JST68_29880 [Bacteroidetes bacterium]|nr:hypothetical protein [Bacteroidota bacterium]